MYYLRHNVKKNPDTYVTTMSAVLLWVAVTNIYEYKGFTNILSLMPLILPYCKKYFKVYEKSVIPVRIDVSR